MLEVRALRKAFGHVVAVDGVSFRVGLGKSIGLLGPNGAGKTTTVSIICGLLRPDAGEVLIDGRPLRGDTDPSKRKIGLVTQELALFEDLSARENLHTFGAMYDLDPSVLRDAIASALELVGLADRAKDRVKTFSGGMKRRLNLAAALLHDPELLILDEPTVGVDPQSRNAIFENLESLRARGKSLLYTTHYMEEAERLCERIVVMDHGRVVADDGLRGLYRLLPASNRVEIELAQPSADGGGAWLENVRRIEGVASASVEGPNLSIDVAELSTTMPRILGWLSENGRPFVHAVTERPNLEAVFLHLTGRSLRDP
jgi:ABC-2 type transport system ATP-binding protein